MRTSGSSPGTEYRSSSGGYTLLEMVVVLAIMALVAGVAAVRVFSLIDSWRVRSQLESIEGQFAHLPVLARQAGQEIVLPPSAASAEGIESQPVMTLPADWLVRFREPLRVHASGLCEGADVTLEHGSRRFRRAITPPFCQVKPVGDAL